MSPSLEQFISLVRRYPLCVGCAVLALLSGGGAWYLHSDIADLAEPYAQLAKEYDDMLTLTKGGLTQRQELEAVREAARRIDENLVIEDKNFENNNYFYRFEEQSKAHVELHPLNSPNTDTTALFRRMPYTMRVSGTYEQVAAFLLAVETGPRLAKITSFTISRSTAGGKDAGARGGGDSTVDAPVPGSTNIALDLSLELLGKK